MWSRRALGGTRLQKQPAIATTDGKVCTAVLIGRQPPAIVFVHSAARVHQTENKLPE
jgi:hypothetical protein